jgi:hypothetical protein
MKSGMINKNILEVLVLITYLVLFKEDLNNNTWDCDGMLIKFDWNIR